MNPKRLEPWQRMFEYQEQTRKDDVDYSAWLQGQYICEAVAHALNSKKSPYPEEPYLVSQRRKDQEDADKMAADSFMAFAMVWNKQFEARQQSEA